MAAGRAKNGDTRKKGGRAIIGVNRIWNVIFGSLAGLGLWATAHAQDASSPTFQKFLSGNSFKITATAPASSNKFSLGLRSNDSTSHSSLKQDADSRLGQWQRQLNLNAIAVAENGISFKFDGKIQDSRNVYGDTIAGINFGAADKWEENTVGSTKFGIGILGERLRYTLRYDWSNYTGSDAYLKEPAKKDKKDKARFFGRDDTDGSAVSHRLDLDVLQFKNWSVSVFGERRTVSPFFETIGKTKKEKKKDIFADADHEDFRYGTVLGFGPASLTLGLTRSQKTSESDEDPVYPRQALYESKLALDLDDLRHRLGAGSDDAVWSVAPGSIWLNYSKGKINVGDGDLFPDDATTDFSAGASWYGDWGYADLSLWRSFYDGRQIGAESADWSGNGIDLGYGLNRAWWSIGGNMSFGRYDNLEESSKTVDYSYDGGLWLSLEPQGLPAFAANLSTGRYSSKYYAYVGSGLWDYWEADALLDFSGHLPERLQNANSSLKLFYLLKGNASHEEFESSSESNLENAHAFGVRFSTGF